VTAPYFSQQRERPIQQLLQVMQWGEQQRLAQQQAETQRNASSANIVQTFMTLAPNQPAKDRNALAQILGKAAGVDPNMLLSAVAERPVSATTSSDAVAAAKAQGIDLPALQRAAGMAGQVPDETIKDATINAATGAITGMNAGAARQAAATASRTAISDKQLVEGLTNQMGLTLDANQKKHYEVQAEQLRQGWSRLADDKTAEAARLAIMRGQLQLEQEKFNLLKQGKVEEAQRLQFGNPEELLKSYNSLLTTATSGVLTDEARVNYAMVMSHMQKQLAQMIAVSDPELAAKFLAESDPNKLLGISPKGLTGTFRTTKK